MKDAVCEMVQSQIRFLKALVVTSLAGLMVSLVTSVDQSSNRRPATQQFPQSISAHDTYRVTYTPADFL